MKSMLTTMAAVALSAYGVFATVGCAGSARATAKQDQSITPSLPPYNGPKARIAIGKFDWAVGNGGSTTLKMEGPNGSYTWSVGQQSECMGGLGDILTTALMESNRYQVLEALDLDPLKSEIGMGEDGYVKDETSVKKGGWEGADLIVLASITSWEPDAGGKTIGAGGILPGALGGLKIGKKKAKMGMHIRLVDPRSRITVASKGIEGEATSWNATGGTGALLGGAAVGGFLSQYEKTPMGTAISTCIAEAVTLVAQNTPQQYFKY